MGFSILGFEEYSSGAEGSETRHAAVNVVSADEGGQHYELGQMIMMTEEDDVRDTCNETSPTRGGGSPNDPPSCRHGVANSSSILGDMTLFRDFFLAAFSDYNVACCGGEGIFDDCNNVMSGKNSYCSAKLAPTSDSSSYHHHPTSIRTSSLIGRTTSSLSQNSTHSFQNNPSHDGNKRRQRPLAVAVGFKYAEDMNGRPIIITPGNRLMPVRGPRTSPSSSPSSQPTSYSRKEISPNVLFPFDHESKKGPRAPLSYKPSQQQQQQQQPASLN